MCLCIFYLLKQETELVPLTLGSLEREGGGGGGGGEEEGGEEQTFCEVATWQEVCILSAQTPRLNKVV